MSEDINIWTNGGGYSVVQDPETGEMAYLHRLSAVVEHGIKALSGHTETHHRVCKMIDIPEGVAPIDPTAHRVAHGQGDPTVAPDDVLSADGDM